MLVAVSPLHPTALAQAERLKAANSLEPAVELIMTPSRREVGQPAADIATRFGEHVTHVLQRGGFAAIVLVGGDGAGAVLDRLGVERIMIDSAI